MKIEELKLKDMDGMSISEEMTNAEVSIRNAFLFIEAIMVEVKEYPRKTSLYLDDGDIGMLTDFYDITLKAFDRAESTFWEIEGH